MVDLLKVYHKMPYPLRVAAASLRGYALTRTRYGPETEQMVASALIRETWTAEQWKNDQEERLAYLLNRAATQVPYYQQIWSERRAKGDHSSFEQLENWPILKKEDLRSQPERFVAADLDRQHLLSDHTSGTTGTPVTIWYPRQTLRQWYALHEARTHIWNGVDRNDRWAIIGGQLVTPANQTRPPFWVWNQGLKQLYLSAYHLAPAVISSYIQAIQRHHVVYMLGYPSALYALAQGILDQNLSAPALKVVLCNAEPLYPYQRDAISKAFQCPVRNTYGMSEIAVGASECSAGQMHLWPDAGLIETFAFDRDEVIPTGQEGRFLVTGLLNADMPLIRYEVGDRGILAEGGQTCACGRSLPILNSVEGRLDDVVFTPDGRQVGRLDPVFKAGFAIHGAQIVQENKDLIRVKLIPAPGYTSDQGDQIAKRLLDRVGKMTVEVELVKEIPKTSNGKSRLVINRLKDLKK